MKMKNTMLLAMAASMMTASLPAQAGEYVTNFAAGKLLPTSQGLPGSIFANSFGNTLAFSDSIEFSDGVARGIFHTHEWYSDHGLLADEGDGVNHEENAAE